MTEPSHSPLLGDEDHVLTTESADHALDFHRLAMHRPNCSDAMKSKRLIFLFLLLLVLFLVSFRTDVYTLLHPASRPLSCSSQILQQKQPKRLHLLIPINEPAARQSSHFCKTLLSAIVHGYEPTVINWTREDAALAMHRMKVLGVYDYLMNHTTTNTTDPEQEDLVFMIDALDVWLQLPPAVLIQRFEKLRTDAVITGAEKACWPNDPASHACQDVPESTLPKGVYGLSDEPEYDYGGHTRPRWANSGMVLGTVTAMKALYRDLYRLVHMPGFDGGSDQASFNELLADRRLTLDYSSRLFWSTVATDPERSGVFVNMPPEGLPFLGDTDAQGGVGNHYTAASHKGPEVTPSPDDNNDNFNNNTEAGDTGVIPLSLYPTMLLYAPTGSIPCAVHFTDHSHKDLMDAWWGKLWWNAAGDPRFNGTVVQRLLRAPPVRFIHSSNEDEKEAQTDKEVRSSATWRELCDMHRLVDFS